MAYEVWWAPVLGFAISRLAVFAALLALSTRGPGHEHDHGHEPAEALHAG